MYATLPQTQQGKAGPDGTAPASTMRYPPINFVYRHLHDSIRTELASVSELVLALEEDVNSEDVLQQLKVLESRYQMLEQINRYHSSVEDEVRTPDTIRITPRTLSVHTLHAHPRRKGGLRNHCGPVAACRRSQHGLKKFLPDASHLSCRSCTRRSNTKCVT